MAYLMIFLVPFAIYQMKIINSDPDVEKSKFQQLSMISLFIFSLAVPVICLFDILNKFELSNQALAYTTGALSLPYFIFLILYGSKKIERM